MTNTFPAIRHEGCEVEHQEAYRAARAWVWSRIVLFQDTEELRDFFYVERWEVFCFSGFEGTFEINGNVAITTSRCDAVAKYLATYLFNTGGDVQRAAFFDFSQNIVEKFGRIYFSYWARAYVGEDIYFEPAHDVKSVLRCPYVFLIVVPFESDRAESVFACAYSFFLLLLLS